LAGIVEGNFSYFKKSGRVEGGEESGEIGEETKGK